MNRIDRTFAKHLIGNSAHRWMPAISCTVRLPGLFAAIVLVSAVGVLASCGESRNREDLAVRMAAEEGRAEDDARIAELKAGIRDVDAQVERTIKAVRDQGNYWRLLGMKYMDYRMWGRAMDAFGEAVAINPDHAPLLYNRALCAGQMALAADTPESRSDFLTQAERGYRRALDVDPRYTPAMYGLAVLLVFERDDAADAVPLLEDYLSIERSDIPARFLLARAYLQVGRATDALDLYDEIGRLAKNAADIDKAADLYRRVAGGDYGP